MGESPRTDPVPDTTPFSIVTFGPLSLSHKPIVGSYAGGSSSSRLPKQPAKRAGEIASGERGAQADEGLAKKARRARARTAHRRRSGKALLVRARLHARRASPIRDNSSSRDAISSHGTRLNLRIN